MLELKIDYDAQRLICWGLAVPRQDIEDHLVAGSAGVECFAHCRLDGLQAIAQYCGQHADKATVSFISAAQLAPQPGKRRRQSPVLEWCAVAQRAGLVHQYRQIVPRIVNRAVAPEVARMLGNDLVTQANDNPVGIGADLNRTAHRPCRHRVAVAVETDQAGAGHCVARLVEAIERCQHRLQRRPLGFQGLCDGHVLLLGVRVHRGPAQALGFKPTVQFLNAGKLQPWLEKATAYRLNLVLDLTLLPACRWRTGGRLDHVVIGHDQEPAVEDALLADEHRRHRSLHIIVDPAQRHPAEEGKAAGMRVEHHLLRLARIDPHIYRARRAQPHMRYLHAHRLARDLHVLVAPVELVCLARLEQQRDERRHVAPGIPAAIICPAPRIAPDRIIRSLETFTQQQIMDPRHPQTVTPMPRFVLRQQCVEAFLERTDPGQRLNRAMIVKRPFRSIDRLAHHLARQPQIPRNLPDALAARALAPNPYNCLHHQHPDLAT